MPAGLPVRIAVLTVVGIAAASIMLSFTHGCYFPSPLIVDYERFLEVGGNLSPIIVEVRDLDGNPVPNAAVIVTGLGAAGSNVTNESGIAQIVLKNPPTGVGYLRIEVRPRSGCYQEYREELAIRVLRYG